MDLTPHLGRFRSLTASLTTTQLVSLGVTFTVVVTIVVGSAWWLNAPTYTLLFADMDAESAAQVVTRLKSMKTAYRLDEGGRAIRVRSDRIDELRLELTSQGLPASGRIGFEIFDRTAFGATEFLEKVNYRRALEGEIARTVGTISEVASARVHIAMGKDSLFGEPRPAKASVVLKLRANRPLATSTVSGISNLVAASVEGLRPESVVILDSFGRPLSRPGDDTDDALGGAQLERQQRLERDLATRVVAMLEPVVGEDRVRVNVALKLNPQTREETEERWDPNTVVRSRQISSDLANLAATPGGMAGARGNLPPTPSDPKVPPPVMQAALPSTSRNAETTNYEVSRTTRHVVQPAGEISRLSVAVILDDEHVLRKGEDGRSRAARAPRKPEELQKIHGLVAAAVGFDPERGDQLTVENVAFEEPLVDDAAPPSVLERFAPQIREGSRLGVVLLIALAAFLLFLRPLIRRAGFLQASERTKEREKQPEQIAAAPPPQLPRTVADLESQIEAEIDAAAAEKLPESRRLPVLTRRVSTISLKEPENVAKLLRSWIHEQER